MKNPWTTLPNTSPYVLAEDATAIETFQSRSTDETRLHLDILPEPFLGRPDAPIVLLNLNPGFSEAETEYHTLDEYFEKSARANLTHAEQEYPFYFLNPEKERQSPGHLWWRSRLRTLLDIYGPKKLANELLCVEYFPYHSMRYSGDCPTLPSQEYGFYLVHEAMSRNAVIIIMRAKKLWLASVPDLESHPHHTLHNPRAVYVTEGNAGAGYSAIRERLG